VRIVKLPPERAEGSENTQETVHTQVIPTGILGNGVHVLRRDEANGSIPIGDTEHLLAGPNDLPDGHGSIESRDEVIDPLGTQGVLERDVLNGLCHIVARDYIQHGIAIPWYQSHTVCRY